MNRKRLYFIAPRDMRKNRADCVHIMKICDQFAGQGYEVVLVTPRVLRPEYPVTRGEIFALYGMRETFGIVELPTFLTDQTNDLLARVQKFLAFGLFYLKERFCGRLGPEVTLYCKCYISTFPALLLRRVGLLKSRLFFEKAEFTPGHRMHQFTAENVDGVICGNQYIHDRVAAEYAIPRQRIQRLTFGTQYPEIRAHLAAHPAPGRASLGLPVGKRLIMYAGKVAPSMLEIRYILEAARLVPEEEFALVGVREDFRPWFAEYFAAHQMRNVTLIGFQSLTRFFEYVSSADLLVSYYDSFDALSSTQRGPSKACVYLCFGQPVIMADLPSLREWWTDEQIFFVPPDQPALLAEKIRYILAHPAEARDRASKCLEFAKTHTYESTYLEVGRFMDSRRQAAAPVNAALPATHNPGRRPQANPVLAQHGPSRAGQNLKCEPDSANLK